jgi:hypothetical protein
MALSIKAPVGEKKRNTEGPAVKNNPEDVNTVQLMLFANGFEGPITGKCTSGMIKAIQSFQKSKLGYKKPDGVVDPGGATWKAGLPKLLAKIAADQKILDEMVLIKENGKEKYISKTEYQKGQDALKKKVVEKADRMYSDAESWVDFARDCSETAAGADGFMMSFTSFIVSSVSSGKSEPPYGPLTDARSQASYLKAMVNRKEPEWKKVLEQDKKATKAHKKGKDAFAKFIGTRISTASSIVGKLEAVREINFAVVEVYMTAQLVARGNSPAKAHAIAAAGTEAMKSSADQLGNYLAGNKVTWDSALKKVAVDTAFAGAAGFVGGKLTGPLLTKTTSALSKALLPQIAQTFPQKTLDIFLKKVMTTKAAQEVVNAGAKETIGLFKPFIEKGKPPGKKDIEAAMIKTLTAGMLKAAPIKALSAFADKMPAKVQETLKDKLVPALANSSLNTLRKKLGDAAIDKLPDAFKTKMFGDIADAVKGKSAEIYALSAAEGSSGDTNENQLHKLGEAGLRKDAELRKAIEAMIESKVEKQVKAMK